MKRLSRAPSGDGMTIAMPSAIAKQAAAEEAGDVEHRIVGEDDVVGRVRHHQGIGPELVREAAMGQPHELRRPGGAAGMHIGGDVVGRDRALESRAGRPAGAAASVSRSDSAASSPPGPGTDRMRTSGDLAAHRLQVLPDLESRRRAERDDDLRRASSG